MRGKFSKILLLIFLILIDELALIKFELILTFKNFNFINSPEIENKAIQFSESSPKF